MDSVVSCVFKLLSEVGKHWKHFLNDPITYD